MTSSNLVRTIVVFFTIFLGSMATLLAADGKKAAQQKTKPAMLVTTAQVTEGTIRPTTEFIGTTYFARVSKVATDGEGLVQKVNFEVGDRVKQGDPLALLDSELLDTSIIGTRAAFEQNLVDLEKAKRDCKRTALLLKDQLLPEADYDTYLSKKDSLSKRSIVLESKLNTLLIEKRKKNILAPFDGLVIEKSVETGEWLSRGGQIAVIVDNTEIDILVDVSATLLDFLKKGNSAAVTIGGRKLTATFLTFIPKGDIATRTFTAKFRLNTADRILEGMEARITLPRAGETHGLLVPRDAVVNKSGRYSIFIVDDGNAKNIPVKVVAYMDLVARISGPGLKTGQSVIVKGSKRIRNGQPVKF
jgi:RND family efflux transporter MFP subunit